MKSKLFIFSVAILFFVVRVCGQTCNGPGQSPNNSLEVCATDTFQQGSVPVCGGSNIPVPGCTGLQDLNPYWYTINCYSSGTLGFVINPENSSDDYDWQLFDVTGRDPIDVYTDVSLFVACNWSGAPGRTGASLLGTKLITCGSTGTPYESAFSSMPRLDSGHTYKLMVSHFSGSGQSGYGLSFGGGTAGITDLTQPGLANARAICDGVKMTLKLTKRMKCGNINPNGFSITPAFANIIAAEGVNCSNSLDMDSVLLTLSSPVPPGNYSIAVTNSNTLVDNCDRPIPPGQSLSVTVFPQIPTPMDSLTKIGCAPDELKLVFAKPMKCSSIAADGSDFIVTGPTPVTVASASGNCTNSDSTNNTITVKLSAPIQTAGNYRVTLRTGSDGNTVLNECGMATAAGAFINFSAADTVNASFNYNIRLGCKTDIIDFSHDGRNGVNSWLWKFDNIIASTKKDTSISYTVFGNKKAMLTVSNGVCSDTKNVDTILLDNELKAVFENTAVVCPEDGATFRDKSYKHVIGWHWSFGDGATSTLQSPPVKFYPANNDNSIKQLPVQLIVTNNIGCSDTATSTIRVVGNCYIGIPTAFTPNADGLNDYLYPTNAYKAKDLYFTVYNRNGNKLFESRDWQIKWDGTYKGNPLDPGTYVWFLQYTHIETGQKYSLKGSTVLIR